MQNENIMKYSPLTIYIWFGFTKFVVVFDKNI